MVSFFWGNTYKIHIDKILKLQKWALRTISREHYRCHTDPTASDYSVHKRNKMFSDRAIRAAGPTLWNSLDDKFKQCKSSKHFRNMYKSNLIACYSWLVCIFVSLWCHVLFGSSLVWFEGVLCLILIFFFFFFFFVKFGVFSSGLFGLSNTLQYLLTFRYCSALLIYVMDCNVYYDIVKIEWMNKWISNDKNSKG